MNDKKKMKRKKKEELCGLFEMFFQNSFLFFKNKNIKNLFDN